MFYAYAMCELQDADQDVHSQFEMCHLVFTISILALYLLVCLYSVCVAEQAGQSLTQVKLV